ncbi:MAG: metal ABC transporter ATP-binding protein [Methanomicrobiales archaeon]
MLSSAESRNNGAVISLSEIYTAYEGADLPVIRGVSVSIDPGEYVIIGGPNGAGKTTLLESINGLLPITHGSATICGRDIRTCGSAIRKRTGYVLQNFQFDPMTPFTVEQVVMMGRYGLLGFFRRPKSDDHQAVERALRLLGIEDLAKNPIGTLSGGQQQRVLIAQNIAKNPDVLLLDEPFSNLDLAGREQISTILRDLADSGMTILVVSHAFDGLPDTTIRILVMNRGQITHDDVCDASYVEETVRNASRAP